MQTSTPTVFPSLGRKKAYQEITDTIRHEIFSRRLQPLHRLPTERDIAEQCGVSRMVVREAIRSLEREGLVTVKKGPKGGIFVAQDFDRPINDSITNMLAGGGINLGDLSEVRALVEPYAAARAAEHATEANLEELAVLLERAEAADPADLRAHNIEFHRVILRISGNPVLRLVGDAVLTILSEQVRHVATNEASAKARHMHRAIVAAMRSRDAAQAQRLMSEDIEAIRRRLGALGGGS